MGWWQNVDKLYLRDVFWWGLRRAEERRREREALARQKEQSQQNGPNWGQVAAAGVGIAGALATTNVADFKPGQEGTFDHNWSNSSMLAQRNNQSKDIAQGTRDQGNRNRGTSQQY